MLNTFLIFLLIISVIMLIMFEVINISVFGRPLKRWERDIFELVLYEYKLNSRDSEILTPPLFSSSLYIAKSNTLLFKWYINDVGQVWRFSKLSKIIDGRSKELLNKM